ncbi:uncharacterized protein WM277_009900 [Molossus nigricans]
MKPGTELKPTKVELNLCVKPNSRRTTKQDSFKRSSGIQPIPAGLSKAYLKNEEIKSQRRSQAACPRSHSQDVEERWFGPRQVLELEGVRRLVIKGLFIKGI